ncbi:MAG: L,D-transpeptidase family protein [Myxococcales bacterium]|nr:L,D-transpeptidase family protein [Myxococcales bacterium]
MKRATRFLAVAAVMGLVTLACVATYPRPSLADDLRFDRLVLDKSDHRLDAYADGELVRSYRVAIGRGGSGHKRMEGDGHTPEGDYVIDGRWPSKQFRRFLHISYPNAADRKAFAEAKRDGDIPADAKIGGDIGLHGESQNRRGWPHKLVDWTQGCVAVDDDEIDELYRRVAPRATITITP